MKKISIAMFSTLVGASYKAPQLRILIPKLYDKGYLVKAYGLYTRSVKSELERERDSINVSIIIPIILRYFKKIINILKGKSYYTYLMGEWLVGIRFKNQLKKDDSEIVILKMRPYSLVKAAKKAGKKVIVEAGELHPRYTQSLISKERKKYKLKCDTIFENEKAVKDFEKSLDISDKIVVLSEESKKTYLKYGVPQEKLTVIGLGVEEIFTKGLILNKKENFDKELIFITTAFHSMVKGTHRLLLAWNKIKDSNVKLYVVGDIHKDIQEFINANGPFKNVVFTGKLTKNQLKELYSKYNAVGILNSLAEGYPRAVIEYLSQGMPVIVTKPCTCDIIKDGVNGFVINFDDENSLIQSVLRFANNDKLYKEFSDNNSKLELRNLNMYIDELIQLMEDI